MTLWSRPEVVGAMADAANGPETWPGYLLREPLTAPEQGREVNLILPDDHGTHLLGDSLFPTDSLVEKDLDPPLDTSRSALRDPPRPTEDPPGARPLPLRCHPPLDAAQHPIKTEVSVLLAHAGEDLIDWMLAEGGSGIHDATCEQAPADELFGVRQAYTMGSTRAICEEGP